MNITQNHNNINNKFHVIYKYLFFISNDYFFNLWLLPLWWWSALAPHLPRCQKFLVLLVTLFQHHKWLKFITICIVHQLFNCPIDILHQEIVLLNGLCSKFSSYGKIRTQSIVAQFLLASLWVIITIQHISMPALDVLPPSCQNIITWNLLDIFLNKHFANVSTNNPFELKQSTWAFNVKFFLIMVNIEYHLLPKWAFFTFENV